jgi:hypothetical protein
VVEKIEMKQSSHHHEILLLTGTSLTSKQFANTAETNNERKPPAIEELEWVCRNGVLYEMFPEILGNGGSTDKSVLWHASTGKNFLYVSIGPDPLGPEHNTSIDPYFFMMNIPGN